MSKRKLLLADDSVTIQKVVNLTFADEGIEVISVGDGDSAMEKIVEILPDLVMADVNMPGLTGYQICENIRQDEKLRRTPVILLVGSFEPFDEDEARRVGADDYLTKPFQSIRQLVNKVTSLLSSEVTEEIEPAVSEEPADLADTLEMEKTIRDIPVDVPQDFSNAEFDDETIQTSQFTAYSLDETLKFETRPAATIDDFAKTQPLTNDEIKEFDLGDRNVENVEVSDSSGEDVEEIEADETVEELSAELAQVNEDTDARETIGELAEPVGEVESENELSEGINEDTAVREIALTSDDGESNGHPADVWQLGAQDEEMPLPEVASVLESDEDDLLELPPIESDFDGGHGEGESDRNAGLASVDSESDAGDAHKMSSEMIDAIANRVMERLSEKAVKEVAWEVVPQMTELIVKKMAEEKMKE